VKAKALGLVALSLGTLLIAMVGGWSVMYRVFYVVILLGIISWLWTWLGARTTSVERRSRTQSAQVGGFFEEWVAVDNTSLIPKPWVELRSDSNMSQHAARRGFFLGPRGRRSWLIRTQCTSRGKFTLGDIVVATGDPFGLFQRAQHFASETTVIVYPRTVDFVTPGHIPGQLPGGSQQHGRVPFVTPTVSGVRDYQSSDAFNRIHWPSTARLNRLMVKEFELDPFADVWIVLDMNRHTHVGRGEDSTEEYAVTVAASLARHFLIENRAVGLMMQGQVLHPDRGTRQLTKVLDILAVVQANRWETFDELLQGESMRISRLSTVLVVTPSVDAGWVSVCQYLMQRGVSVLATLIEPATFGGSAGSIDVVGSLAAANIPTYLVKHGEPLEGLLAQPNLVNLASGAAHSWSPK
jgi:uncharacterized protein (DUF58 family)